MKILGIKRYVAVPKPYVDERARTLRIEYAQKHLGDDSDAWRRTIFCDEAILRTNGAVKTWVWRRPGEEGLPDCLAPRLFSTRKTVMVWAAIWHGGRSELKRFEKTEFSGPRGGVTAIDYRNQITCGPLEAAWKEVKTRWRGYGNTRILEDNVKVHTGAVTVQPAQRGGFHTWTIPPTPQTSIQLRTLGPCSSVSLQRLITALGPRALSLQKLNASGRRWTRIN